MGFGVKNELKELIKKDNVSAKDVRKFCEESRSVVSGIVIKLFERSPIFCKMVGFTTVFDPAVFLTLDKPPLQKRLKGLLVLLMDHKILSFSQCNSVVMEFNNFYGNNFIMLRSVLEDFIEATDCLDNFWFEKGKISHFKTLAFVAKLVFHGQASVEREFSISNTVHKQQYKRRHNHGKKILLIK